MLLSSLKFRVCLRNGKISKPPSEISLNCSINKNFEFFTKIGFPRHFLNLGERIRPCDPAQAVAHAHTEGARALHEDETLYRNVASMSGLYTSPSLSLPLHLRSYLCRYYLGVRAIVIHTV